VANEDKFFRAEVATGRSVEPGRWHLPPVPLGTSVPFALLLLGAMISAFQHTQIDYRIVEYLNSFAGRSQLLDRTMHAVTTLVLLQGAVFISLIWYLWFACPDTTSRGRVLAGTLTAAIAGMTSRALQLVVPSHLRPLHTPQLNFVLPVSVEPDALNHFNSFPSDHGVVFFGLSATIYRLNPWLGIGAFIWTTAIDTARIYEGYHFPSDIIASAGLGVLMVNLLQPVRRLAQSALALEERFRPTFYTLAFLATYQIASLFDDVRELGRGLMRVVLHHDPFAGG
jgi:undecaprenyl-diphosphatase